MSNTKTMNRWLVVVGALLIQLCLGAIYAWSVFTPGLTAERPMQFATIYRADKLGILDVEFEAMNKELKGPRDQLQETLAKLKGVTDEERVQELAQQRDELRAEIDAIVEEYVPQENLESLTYRFTKEESQWIFGVGLAFFAVFMVVAGRLMPRIGPRSLSVLGGLVLGAGYILAGLFAGQDFWLHMVFVGMIGGAGIGLAYVVPIAVAMRWFPDKKGLITGLAVAGFGFGAMGWIKIAGGWFGLISILGLPMVFIIYGIAFLVIVGIGSIWMVFPPEGWQPEGWTPPAQTDKTAKPAAGTVNFTSSEMLRTPQFYMIVVVYAFVAGAGLMSIGLMKLFPSMALVQSGMDAVQASVVSGTAMAVFFSLANGIGRIAWGAISDGLGRKASVVVNSATQGVFVLLFTLMAGNTWLLYLGATLIGFNYGGCFALFPTITADTFGAKHVGQNYGWVFLAYGVGGILGPVMGGKLGDQGNFPLAFTICGILCLVAAVIAASIKPPEKAEAAA
jgi:OFA family oxalate/formate antiporter-like MFS transporter